MESILTWPPNAWHWLALALVLFSIEMMTGTWDLLWVSIAAALTSAFAVFRKMREDVEEHPTLNKRMAGTLGQRGVVADDFTGGLGRVKLGDTVWSAESIDGANLASGTAVIVEATEGNMLKVRLA